MENFIRVYKNAYSSEYCNEVIKYFEALIAAGFGRTRQQLENVSRNLKDDTSVYLGEQEVSETLDFEVIKISNHFFSLFWERYYADYMANFPVLENYGRHTIYKAKIQKTVPSGGYHIWHSEVGTRKTSDRIAAFTLYLNDVEEGGETEFLYQSLRVKPEQGALVIWPAGYTHAHRGNPPLKETKYILTGWIEFE
jgi:hypothetical protein